MSKAAQINLLVTVVDDKTQKTTDLTSRLRLANIVRWECGGPKRDDGSPRRSIDIDRGNIGISDWLWLAWDGLKRPEDNFDDFVETVESFDIEIEGSEDAETDPKDQS